MPRILVVADEVDDALFGPAVRSIDAELVLSCGDLPFDYLEFIVSMTDVPLLYVPGNHDPDLSGRERLEGWPPPPPKLADADPPGPLGCINVDGRIEDARGLRIAGLGGSVRYREGPNQYSQHEMRARARRIRRQSRRRQLRDGRGVDVLLTHAPPEGVGDGDDPAHRGFAAFVDLVQTLSPRLLVHGHVHSFEGPPAELQLEGTRVVNAIPCRVLELEP